MAQFDVSLTVKPINQAIRPPNQSRVAIESALG
jgi:hypothetical protein